MKQNEENVGESSRLYIMIKILIGFIRTSLRMTKFLVMPQLSIEDRGRLIGLFEACISVIKVL